MARVNAYNVTFAACMPACGALADLLGRRRMFATGLTLLIGSVVFLGLFVTVERRSSHPMFDLGLLTNPRYLGVCLMPFVLSFVFVGLLAFLPTYLIGVGGANADSAGAFMLPR
ncbi:hypothetical protein [Streptomyces sp. NPDC005407]|uniref:hypothetical protein n=1 Tax=Streptomyces sp. NPDC005407 TaxID=3155340 RepID=UPI00339DF049